MSLRCLLLAGFVVCSAGWAPLHGASGTDPSFSSSFAGPASVSSVLPLSDGGALVTGEFELLEGQPRARFARLGAHGAVLGLQVTVGFQPLPPTQIQEVGDGSALLAGEFTSYEGQPTFGLVRVDLATGGLLETFPRPSGGGSYRYLLPGDGFVYRHRMDTQQFDIPLERLLPNRQVDPAFTTRVSFLRGIFAGPAGTLMISDSSTSSEGRLRRVLASGAADAAFPGQTFPRPIIVSAYPDGRLAIYEVGTVAIRSRLTRRLTNGALDDSFAAVELEDTFLPLQIVATAEGSVVLAGFSNGSSSTNPLRYGYGALRVSPAGQTSVLALSTLRGSRVDLRFAASASGPVWAFGYFDGFNRFAAAGLARLGSDLASTPERTFTASFANTLGPIAALQPAPSGGVLVGGTFALSGARAVGNFVRLDSNGAPSGAFASFDGPIHGMGKTADGRLLVWGNFRSVDGQACARVALLTADGQRDPSFVSVLDPEEVGAVGGASMDAQGRVVIGGDFRSIGGVPRIAVARLTAVGALDPTFDAGLTLSLGGPDISVVRIGPDGRIYVGGGEASDFTALLQPSANANATGGAISVNVVRLQPDGAPDPTFLSPVQRSSDVRQQVYDLAVEGDSSVYLVGALQRFRSGIGLVATQEYLARLLPGGSLDRSVFSEMFTTNGASITRSLTPTSGGRYWLQTTHTGGQSESPQVLRVLWNGRTDPTWAGTSSPGGLAATGALAERTDGRLVFAGMVGLAHSVYLAVSDDAGAPVIAAQPVSVRANAGRPAVLRASATGGAGIVFAWFHDGAPIAGGADGRLVLPPVTPAELGQYHAVATNSAGTATTNTVQVTFNTPPTLTVPGPQIVEPGVASLLDPPLQFGDAESDLNLRTWGVGEGASGGLGTAANLQIGPPVRAVVPVLQLLAAPLRYRIFVRVEDEDGATTTREIPVQVRGQSYAEWAGLYFTPAELGNPAVSGATADPRGYGLPNLLAYAFGLDPRTSAPSALPQFGADGNGGWQLTYRAPATADSEVSVSVEGSVDLLTWQMLTPEIVQSTLLPSDPRTQGIRARMPAGSGPFFRVRAETQP